MFSGSEAICHFSPKRNRKKEKSVVSFTHEQNIICSQTQSRPQCLRPGQYGYIILVTRARCWGTPLFMSFMYKGDHWSAWLHDSSIIKLSLIFFFSYLSGNPIHCDCSLEWLRLLLVKNVLHAVQDGEHIKCASPLRVGDKALISLSHNQLCGKSTRFPSYKV